MFPYARMTILFSLAACSSSLDAASDGGGSGDDGSQAGDGSKSDGPACALPAPSTDCADALSPGDERECTIVIGGVQRTYLLYAPQSYDPCRPAALVVDAHGAQESAEVHAGLADFYVWPTEGIGSGFRLVADREGFLVATPQGIGNAWGQGDTAFVTAVPAAVGAQAELDNDRVYLSGISNGGALTYWTACGDSGVFHGYAPISAYNGGSCPGTHPAPLIHFHSPDDALVSYTGGQTSFQKWRVANHCDTTPTETFRFGGANGDPRPVCLSDSGSWQLVTCDPSAPATVCQRYTGCDAGDAIFCTVPPDNQYDGGQTGGHILYFNATNVSLAAVSWAILDM